MRAMAFWNVGEFGLSGRHSPDAADCAFSSSRIHPRSVCGCVGSPHSWHGGSCGRRWRSGQTGALCSAPRAGAHSSSAARSRSRRRRKLSRRRASGRRDDQRAARSSPRPRCVRHGRWPMSGSRGREGRSGFSVSAWPRKASRASMPGPFLLAVFRSRFRRFLCRFFSCFFGRLVRSVLGALLVFPSGDIPARKAGPRTSS